ncbi:carotenoid oxygenase [Stemphylium lycopersici]|uniref:Carotenoid oxygenase n=1 Tax=Stemphylium lycopersici TaxID=183478 RepID=A0A364MWA3_STELY|nr:carotenoid oxygenase [Stemphylium lycopersici]
MSKSGQNNNSNHNKPTSRHPYLSGNFAPVTKSWPPTPVSWTGRIPEELLGGMYVRNGGNPVTNSDLGREAHWFDGDGMLSGVWFSRSPTDPSKPVVNFVNQFILTDVYLTAVQNPKLRTPILPSIATLVNPASSLLLILWRILRTVLIVLWTHISGSASAIKRISVANTSILYHDGRALATCESGPPMRITLPGLETVGWFNGNNAEGEPAPQDNSHTQDEKHDTFGGKGLLSWMGEWTTGHPKVDKVTDELVLFHCNFVPPYVHYSLLPAEGSSTTQPGPDSKAIVNAAVPGCSGGRLMHDFGVARHHTVILDMPLSLTPLNLAKNKPVVFYEPEKPARFGVFPRRHPELVRWFETDGCCILHTANTWDEYDSNNEVTAVNMLACRLTSASLVFSAGNIEPPPHPNRKEKSVNKPMSFFAKYTDDEDDKDPEKSSLNESSPLLGRQSTGRHDQPGPSTMSSNIPISYDDEEQCRLYYYRFSLESGTANTITHQFALSAIPFEFPSISPLTEMARARYVYGCSTMDESFGAALGKATKIDVLIRMDVQSLLKRAQDSPPEEITGCVDNRSIDEILASEDPNDPIKTFRLPPNHFGQEARFVPRKPSKDVVTHDADSDELDGYLLFYVFNEEQLDQEGECGPDAKSELWVLDARDMQTVVCKVQLATRIPYGLHGNWFTEEEIARQRDVEKLRSESGDCYDTRWSHLQKAIISYLG